MFYIITAVQGKTMRYERYILGPIETNTYIIYSRDAQAAIIDPALASPEIFEFITAKKLSVCAVILTHSHVDHVHGAQEAADRFRAPIYMHSGAEKLRSFYSESCSRLGFSPNSLPENYQPAEKAGAITLGAESVTLITTPGHSPCGISLTADTFVITGDLLFQDDIGRYDLPFASLPALYNSLKKIKALPPALEILPGHGPTTTLKRELEHNEYLRRLP
jgi:hydroxyacylglutathione hydrolase